jgi:LacI family transcriptional regulator
MASRPTIHDVAREAGVSTATVDRVLNAREKVREDTARRVYEAARLVGYHATPLIGQRVQLDLPRLRLGVVLHKEKQAFYQTLRLRSNAQSPTPLACGHRPLSSLHLLRRQRTSPR